ncbi:MAG: thiolase [Chloroflexi bacterium]|nr:thiolase [Chloroflexota bacterium]
MLDLSGEAAIVGVDESDQIGRIPGKSSLQHHMEASYNALADAGLSIKDVDGIFCAATSPLTIAEYFGITPKHTDGTSVGGSSFVIHVAHALEAIAAGRCEVALITHGEAGRAQRRSGGTDMGLPGSQYELPYGIAAPPMSYAMACTRYMHLYGEDRTRQGMAEVAVATRKWANLNPKAFMHSEKMSFEDYHSSRWVAWPFHLPDCCLAIDGGGACVVVSPEVARSCRKKPVWVVGAGEGHSHGMISQMPDLTRTIAYHSGPAALRMAGVAHRDINLAMIYDSFTYTVLVTLESLGFCGRGEAPDFVANQRTAPGGEFAMNTNGGGLSYCHTGMYGMFLLLEATRQLRGEAGPRQVKDCKLALVNGTGGNLSSTGTLVLGADA